MLLFLDLSAFGSLSGLHRNLNSMKLESLPDTLGSLPSLTALSVSQPERTLYWLELTSLCRGARASSFGLLPDSLFDLKSLVAL